MMKKKKGMKNGGVMTKKGMANGAIVSKMSKGTFS